jgi:hypothetical protein
VSTASRGTPEARAISSAVKTSGVLDTRRKREKAKALPHSPARFTGRSRARAGHNSTAVPLGGQRIWRSLTPERDVTAA